MQMLRSKIRQVAPQWLLRAWFNVREYAFLRANRDRKSVFSSIHAQNIWRNPESLSGFGSTLSATDQTRAGLEGLISAHHIRSLLDVPSGDYNWMRHLKFSGQYIGADIVTDLVAENQRRFGDELHRFVQLDLVKDQLPESELVLCRECINHLSLAEGHAAFRNLTTAARRFLVVTHYPQVQCNADQPASFRYRPLNFTKSPFLAREPDLLIDESRSHDGKCLAVWDMDRGPLEAPSASVT